jgi:hypothetical protein
MVGATGFREVHAEQKSADRSLSAATLKVRMLVDPFRDIMYEILHELFGTAESIAQASVAHLTAIALAGFTVVTQHARTVPKQGKAISKMVGTLRRLPRHLQQCEFGKHGVRQNNTVLGQEIDSHDCRLVPISRLATYILEILTIQEF